MAVKFFLSFFLLPSILLGYCPQEVLGDLFIDVQMEEVFPDSKLFVDANPKCSPRQILHIYNQESPKDLKKFIFTYFDIPTSPPPPSNTHLSMIEYLRTTWEQLEKSSICAYRELTTLLPLPYPYVVPGERFREIYYWDSFFSMLGLLLSDRTDLVQGMLTDFAYLIDQYGFIPNGNRSYYLTRSQPPFFSLMVRLCTCPEKYLKQLEKEYCFWMTKRFVSETHLNQYSDNACTPRPEAYREDVLNAQKFAVDQRADYYRNVRAAAESGWDFSSRWLDEEGDIITTHLVEVDLNCLIYHEEKLLGELYAAQGCEERASYYWQRAAERRCAILKYFWDEEKGYFFDYDFVKEKRSERYTLAGVFPLLFNIATEEQAEMVAKTLKERFLLPGGLVTTLEETGEQWDYPNGWAPLQWVAVQGLKNYGKKQLAEDIIECWLKTNELHYATTGLMFEKYNVVNKEKKGAGGEYALQFGFGWTNGVALDFIAWTNKRRFYKVAASGNKK